MSVTRHALLVLALFSVLVLTSGPVSAQPVTGALSTPYLGGTTYPSVGAIGSTGFGGYGGFGGWPFWGTQIDPLTGFMFGSAAITNANAQYQLTIQQARLQMAYANQAAIDVRRKMFDQIVYERAYMAANFNPDTVREREMEAALRTARRNPRQVDVFNADALNSLMTHLIKQQGAGARGPKVELDEDVLKHINVTSGAGGNIGLLKDGGKLQWPLSLQRPEFTALEESLNDFCAEAVGQVKTGNQMKGNTSKDIQDRLEKLDDLLNQTVRDMTPSQFVEASRYLGQLKSAFKALTDPNAASYFNRKWAAQGKSVAELVDNMSKNGLRFAPATQGDEAYYRALLNQLAAYDELLVSASGPSGSPSPR
jgi:hypothetical protein